MMAFEIGLARGPGMRNAVGWMPPLAAGAALGLAGAAWAGAPGALVCSLVVAAIAAVAFWRERVPARPLAPAASSTQSSDKMEAIGNLTGAVAHDFNNLLGVIIGNLDLLREATRGRSEMDDLSRDALDAALRGAALTRSLLAFAGRQPLTPQPLDVNALLRDIATGLGPILGPGIEIILEAEAQLWRASADPVQLKAALTELATNARHAMPQGGKLTIATSNRSRPKGARMGGDYVRIEVTDTGSGMPPEVLGRIFEPFFTTREDGGARGLGLSAVFGYIKQSGGHIDVRSNPGRGTSFRLYLPRAARDEQSAPRDPEHSLRGRGETVLVVEDNAEMRRLALRQLKDLGYAVREAENAAAAMALLAKDSSVDVLFSDVVMPGEMDGIALARSVVQRWPKVKIMLTSGFPGTKITGSSGIATTTPLLCKPYRREDLALALRAVLTDLR